jgi:hypothetical protein
VVRQDKERNDSGGLEDLLLRVLAEMGFDAKKKVRKNKTGLNHHLTSENVRKPRENIWMLSQNPR